MTITTGVWAAFGQGIAMAELSDQAGTGRIAAAVGWWVGLVTRAPLAVLAALTALVGISIWAAAGLEIDTDSSRMLNPELPFQADALALRAAFPEDKTAILILVEAETAETADQAVTQIATKLEDAPGIARVFAPSIDPYLLRNGLLWSDLAAFDGQMRRISQSANLIATLRSDPNVAGFLSALDQARRLAEGAGRGADLAPIYQEAAKVFDAAAEGRVAPLAWISAMAGDAGSSAVLRVLTVTPEPDYTALNPVKPALTAVSAAVDQAAAPDVSIGITGDPALRAEELRSVTARIFWSLALSVVFVAGVLWLALGSLGRMGISLAALLATLVLTAGAAAVTVGSLNLISIAFIVLMVGLGIDFAIHFLAHLDEKSGGPEPTGETLARTGRSLGPALVLAAGSTSLAFFAFTVTDFRGMAQLGVIGGVGVLIAFAVAITLLPAAVALRPALALGKPRGAVPGFLRARPVFTLSMVVLGLASAMIATGARFDSDPMGLRDPESGSVQSFLRLTQEPGRNPLRASLLVADAEEAARLAPVFEALPSVDRVLSLDALIPEAQGRKLDLLDLAWPSLDHAVQGVPEDLTGDNEGRALLSPISLAANLGDSPAERSLAAALTRFAYAATPRAQTAAEEALFLHFPALLQRLSALTEMDEVTRAGLPSVLRERYLSPSGQYRIEILPVGDLADPSTRSSFVAEITSFAPKATGGPVQIEGARGAVSAAMLVALAVSLAGAAMLSGLVLRSLTGVVAILLPILLAGAVCMAATVLLDMPFNYANVIVLPLMIGIGVDTGIHLALRARQEDAVFETATPMAAFYSALTTIAAFGTLGLSHHVGTASMGILLAIGLSATVLMCFALTPPLARLGRDRFTRS
ncbi:MAG: MMPL family transporter [Pseudomonadota bacterium]